MLARLALAAALVSLAATAPASAAPTTFAPPKYIDEEYPGGEPLMWTDLKHGTLVYSTHEGTTHAYRPGVLNPQTAVFASQYRNQVKIWTSKDGGETWTRSSFAGTGFATDPTVNTGFSDPDLTQDEGGRIYNTGIMLATDALFSSDDGGVTWDRGNPNCHNGDRPWIVGGKPDEAFFFTNTLEGGIGQTMFTTTDGGATCSATGIPNGGDWPDGGSWTGNGKPYMNHVTGTIVAPITGGGKIGISTWKRGEAAFTPRMALDGVDYYAHWPAIAVDGAGTTYLVFDTDPSQEGTSGGCDGRATPAANQIVLMYTKDDGKTWSAPIPIASPSEKRVLWPWVAAGDAGKVSITWYETDKIADLACQPAALTVQHATVLNASDDAKRTVEVVNASGRPIAVNNICQNGTTCVATGEDRRLGDFFSNVVDARGCVMIATGDTMKADPERLTSLPLLITQISGPRLIGSGDCSGVVDPPGAGLPAQPKPSVSPTSRKCISRRRFEIRLRAPKGQRLGGARVTVAGKRVKVRKRGQRLVATVDLRRLRKSRFTVKIVAFTTQGRRVTETRKYRTCAKKRRR